MGLYRRIVQLSVPVDRVALPKGINLFVLTDVPPVVVLWCSDNASLNKGDQKTDADLASAAASLGTVIKSHPNNPGSGTFQVIDKDLKTVLESG